MSRVRAVAAVALGLLAALRAQAAPVDAGDYVIRVQGRPAGELRVREGESPGSVRADFSWRDNGRGPTIEERLALDADGRVARLQLRGTSMFGGTIDEEAEFADGRIRWRSPADRGDEAAAAGTVFVPLESTPAYWAQLLRAVLDAPGAEAVAPGGATLRARRLAATTVEGAGGPQPVALYALTGADLSPWYLWVRDDAGRALFGAVAPGWALTPAGYEAAGPALFARQREAAIEHDAAIRTRHAQPLPGLTVIRAVRWFDAPAATMRGPSDVYLFDGRIGAITPPGALSVEPDQRIDGRGRSLLPGLWDMHAHVWSGDAAQHVAAGVTSVRDMANQNAELQRLREQIAQGRIVGPRIEPAGFIEGRSPFSSSNGFVVDDLEAGLRAVDWYAARGYRQIKLYNSIRPAWVKPLAARAHERGLRVAGHVPAFMRAEQAVREGYDELTHLNQVMLNFVSRPGDDSRTLLRFTRVADDTQALSLQDREVRRFVALLKRRGTVVDPTLAIFETMFTQRDGEPNPGFVAIADHMPVVWRRGQLRSEMSPTPAQAPRWKASFERMLGFVGLLHRAGVPLVAGTDGWAGITLHRELALYVQAGIPPAEVLRIATWNAARHLGVSHQRGRIARGLQADLLLVDGDPTRDIAALRRGMLVVQGRDAYVPAALHAEMGIRPFAEPAVVERRAAAAAIPTPAPGASR